jgi:large subunit ribosomal protein L9
MEVILLEKVRNLGGLGDQVKVKPGFARNYLIPYGKAVVATAASKAEFEARRAELERHQADALGAAKARAEQLAGATVQIARKVSEEGTLFGSVTIKDITDAFAASGFEVHKSELHLPAGPLKDVGDHEIVVTLHPEVEVKIHVSVVGEK